MASLLEKDIQKAILDYLKLRKYVVVKHHSTGFTIREEKVAAFRQGERGVSDLLGCTRTGQFFAIEVKRPGGRATPEQLDFIERVKANGGIGFVAYSVDDVIRQLEPQSGTA